VLTKGYRIKLSRKNFQRTCEYERARANARNVPGLANARNVPGLANARNVPGGQEEQIVNKNFNKI
jgi:hypothetical protein